MQQSGWKRGVGHAALTSMFGLVVLALIAPGSARAQNDEEDNALTRWEKRIWSNITTGLGLVDPNAPAIDYRERSPLVVPPSRDLPPPQTGAVPHGPAWPVDPDAKRAKARADAKRKRTGGNFDHTVSSPRNLTPAELDPAGASTGSTAPSGPGGELNPNPLLPSQLGYVGGLFSGRAFGFGIGPQKDEVGTFKGEPPRAALTAPPAGYQTPSPSQPYGVTRRIEYGKVRPADPAVGAQ
ncbi:MAG: hypothetical protein ACRECO_02125 [Xanthobacteraceae bacterium]